MKSSGLRIATRKRGNIRANLQKVQIAPLPTCLKQLCLPDEPAKAFVPLDVALIYLSDLSRMKILADDHEIRLAPATLRNP